MENENCKQYGHRYEECVILPPDFPELISEMKNINQSDHCGIEFGFKCKVCGKRK